MKTVLSSNTARIVVFAFICSLLACSKEIVPVAVQDETESLNVSVKNGRLTFPGNKDFIQTMNLLRKLQSEQKISDWESSLGFSSLRKFNSDHPSERRLEDMNLPIIYRAVLNADGEYAIGDMIVWFDKGYNYFIPHNDEKLLATVKQNPKSYKMRYETMSKVIPQQTNPDQVKILATNIGTASGPDARYQRIWAVNGQTGPWRKTVFEVQAFSFLVNANQPVTYFQGVNIRIKLEWWSPSNGWQKYASETQDPMINVTANITGAYDTGDEAQSWYTLERYGSASINTSNPHTTYNHDTELYLFAESYHDRALSYTVSVNGTMSSSVSINGSFQTDSPYTVSSTSLW